MPSTNWNHELFAALKAEHQGLSSLLAETKDAIADPERTRNGVEEQISRLVESLQSHFEREESGGYLSDVLVRAPKLVDRVETLQEEHQELLESIVKLQLLTHSAIESPSFWKHVEVQFEQFATNLMTHELAESELLQRAQANGEAAAE